MTKLKTWIDGAGKPATPEQGKLLMNTLATIASEKIQDPDSWRWLGAIVVTPQEIAERIWGPHALPSNSAFVERWILQSAGERKNDAQILVESLPNKALKKMSAKFMGDFYNRYSKGVEIVPSNEHEMRISMNHQGGSCFGILVCDDSHPACKLECEDFYHRTTKAMITAENKIAKFRPKLEGK